MNKKAEKKIKITEWYAVALSAFYFFCILTAYYIMRPLREELAAQVGSSQLPLFFTATFVVSLLLTPLFAWVVSRWPRRLVMPLSYVFFITCQLSFIPFFIDPALLSAQTLGIIFFVWVSVFNLFVMSIFWSFMTDIWSDMQARHLFPIIALGGTVGSLTGPLITRSLVDVVGIAPLLAVSAIFLSGAITCILFLNRWADKYGFHRHEANSNTAIGGSMFDGFKQIFTNKFIALMAILMVLSDAIGTIAYALVTDYSGTQFHNDAIARTRFAANMDLWANGVQIVLQLTITRWLLVRYGAGLTIGLGAAIIALGCLVMAIVPNPYTQFIGSMPWIALMLVISRGFTHGMIQPARETLFTLVPRDLRYKGKNAVDTAVWRAGDIASSLAINGLRTLQVTTAGFGVIGAILVTISGAIGWRLANRVEQGDFEGSN